MASWRSAEDPMEPGGCPYCYGLRGHARLRRVLYDELDAEYRRAKKETKRLGFLYQEACWYNFETHSRDWQHPWHETADQTALLMHGHSYQPTPRGETGSYHVYYYGDARDAPHLPPEILAKELRDAREYEQLLEEERFAPYEWAPGGRKYEQHLRECETAKYLKL